MTARTEKVGLGDKISHGMPWLDDVAATMEQVVRAGPGSGRAARAARLPLRHLARSLPARGGHRRAGRILVGDDGLRPDGRGARGGSDAWAWDSWARPGRRSPAPPSGRTRTNEEAPRRLGALHALLNVAATGLMAGSWLLRQQGRRRSGVALSTLGLGRRPRLGLARGRARLRSGDRRQPRRLREAADRVDRCRGRAWSCRRQTATGRSRRHAGAAAAARRSHPGDRRDVPPSRRPAGRRARSTATRSPVPGTARSSAWTTARCIHGPAMSPSRPTRCGSRTAGSRSGPMPSGLVG